MSDNYNRRHARAHGRALTRLMRLHPEEFRRIVNEERAKEGLAPSDRQRFRPVVALPIDSDELRAMWDAGATRAEMAAHFGCHVRTISNHARRLGLSRRQGWHMRRAA